MRWTEEQNEVISVRDKNILVSAAAGSGKTAVLTERIVQLVTDDRNPVDIDKLVVVTFTRAAAAEMRERIMKALQKKSDEYLSMEEPEIEKIRLINRQLSYIHNARITTIDSFCMDIIRENFAVLDIDPGFKVGEEGELKLLMGDVMAEMLERHYGNGDEKFLNFIDVYSSSRNDENVEEMIYSFYDFAMSYPYPEEWVKNCAKSYQECADHFEEMEWYQAMKHQVESQLAIVCEDIRQCLALIREPDGPFAYESAIMSDYAFLEAVQKEDTYEGRQKLFAIYSPEALSRKKQDVDEQKKTLVKSLRDDYKKVMKKIGEKYYAKPREEVVEDIRQVSDNAEVLADLVLDYIHSYQAAKREKNLVDFNDVEHMALKILVRKNEDGTVTPTPVALAMSDEIAEIMIDEYQDSNYVQELILTSIAKERNLFMVGDVKQSIYKFRMAKPELFLEKYERFSDTEESSDRKIILSRNFRSRKTILDVTNLVFEKIMTKEVGGIEYDRENALYYGADFSTEDSPVEIMIADTSDYDGQYDKSENDQEDDVNEKELEAEMTALKILNLYENKTQIMDRSTGKMRDMRYSDVAVLMRSMGSYAQTYERVFKSKGIPVRCPVKKGCFDSYEVKNILEFLTIIDNPRQDIPLVAVLENIFRMKDEEVARIKLLGGKESMYDNVCAVVHEEYTDQENRQLRDKLNEFYQLLQKYRKEKVYLTIYDLINRILEDTGFEYFISAFPDGTTRLTNIAMLKERASVYQQGSYSGLFNFIRYIEKNRQYEITQETISSAGEEDAVTIMSIHKSKGLEFPIVVIAALGKKFNQMDAAKKIVLHQTYGMGLDRYDSRRNIKSTTLMKSCLSGQIVMENLAEELRILYVAMTRAREKLILAGSGKMEKKWSRYARLSEAVENRKHFHINHLLSAGSYMDLILMSLTQNSAKGYVISSVTAKELASEILKMQFEEKENQDLLTHWDKDYVYNQEIRSNVEESLSYRYPHEDDIRLRAKVSISDIKHKFMKRYDENEEESDEISGYEETEDLLPAFLKKEEETKLTGAARGTAYHRVMELLDYGRDLTDAGKIKVFLEELTEQGMITEEMEKCIFIPDIQKFLLSSIGQRMKQAYQRGTLRREQPFVMGIPAKDIDGDYHGDETVLVQGIIDAYFEEDGEMCIVDYKTDYVDRIEELDNRYHAQLEYYGYAVQRITGKNVKDEIIYSVKFGRELEIKH